MSDHHKRSVVKAISWRFFATFSTMIIVLIFTGKLLLAFGVGAVEFITKIILYYFHERFWEKIKWGRRTRLD